MDGSDHSSAVSRAEIVMQLPDAPPVLTPGLARVLARILAKASRTRALDTIREHVESEALAS